MMFDSERGKWQFFGLVIFVTDPQAVCRVRTVPLTSSLNCSFMKISAAEGATHAAAKTAQRENFMVRGLWCN